MEFQELLKERRSVRAFCEDRKVSDEMLRGIIAKAQLAPSWKNSQTARYYVANTDERIELVRGALPEFNRRSSANASYIVTTYVKDTSGFSAGEPENELGNKWGAYDLGLANAYLLLAAKDSGVDTLVMGIRDANELRKAFGIPKTEQIVSVIALGYAETPVTAKERLPLDEIAHF